MRIKIIRIIIVFFFLILIFDLFYLQLIRGHYFYNLSVNNRIRVIPLEGIRGHIKDRNGVTIADNRLAFNVSVIPQDVSDSDEIFNYLSKVLKIEKKELLQRFFRMKIAPFAPVVVAEDVDKRVAMILEENKYRFPGLYIQESFRRRYPSKEAGAHILGYVGKINKSKIEKLKDYGYTQQSIVGYSGIEESYDSYLKGKEGGLQIEVNSRGKQVRLLSIRDPENGKDIQLTIDSRIQKIAADVLGKRTGSIIVVNYDSGEVLGMVSSPSFNPNVFMDTKRTREKRAYFLNPKAPLLNRSIMGLYPPGSIFKLVLASAGLDIKKITQHTTFHCKGYYSLGGRRFKCAYYLAYNL